MKLVMRKEIDRAVMARLKAPFGCEFIEDAKAAAGGRWRVHDANDDAIASVSGLEEGYAKLIVQALNEHFERRKKNSACMCAHEHGPGACSEPFCRCGHLV